MAHVNQGLWTTAQVTQLVTIFGREEQTSEKGSAVAVLYGLLMDGSLNVFEIERFRRSSLANWHNWKEECSSSKHRGEADWWVCRDLGKWDRLDSHCSNTSYQQLCDEQRKITIPGSFWKVEGSHCGFPPQRPGLRSKCLVSTGLVPRFPGDLFGDERALLVGADHVLAGELRAQALGVIAETRASSVIRRALLRKTANSRQEAADILPGSLAAYWRWSKKFRCRKMSSRKLQHTPGNSPSQLWKESVYSHLAKLFFFGVCSSSVCWNNLGCW